MQKNPLAGVDANLLVALDALIAHENVGRAGRSVGLSASAMSHALGRLRALLDDPILVRTGQRMALTARARELAEPLRTGMEHLARALSRRPLLDLKSERRTLRLAAVDYVQLVLVPPLLRTLQREAPHVDLVVLPFDGTAIKALAAGDLDMVFAANRASGTARSRIIQEEPFMCVVRGGHPVLAGRFTARRYAALDHVLISPRGHTTGAVDTALGRRGLKRRVALVVPSFFAAAEAVAGSDLVLTCGVRSAESARQRLQLAVLEPPVAVKPFSVVMFWHERHENDPFLAWARGQAEAIGRAAQAETVGRGQQV